MLELIVQILGAHAQHKIAIPISHAHSNDHFMGHLNAHKRTKR